MADSPTAIETSAPEQKPGMLASFFFRIISLKALILVPLFLLASLIVFMLTSPSWYASILKHSDLIGTFVKAQNWRLETAIKNEIEAETGLEAFKKEYSRITADYQEKCGRFDLLNKTEEYDSLVGQRKELASLAWKKAPEVFRNEDEFRRYKKEELQRLDVLIDEIKSYRRDNRKAIADADDERIAAEKLFTRSGRELDKKEKRAQKIIMSHDNSFTGKIYSDLKAVSPVLTAELNERIIGRGLKNEIANALSFMTSYYEQVSAGAIYRNPFNLDIAGYSESPRIVVPGLRLSLWVEDDIRGIRQKRHLLSEVFVEKIRELPDLHKKEAFIRLFTFSESSLAESLGRSYLKKVNLSISGGVITMKPLELDGRDAEIMETVMIAATWTKYAIYVLPAAALALLLALLALPVDRERKIRRLAGVLIYPSALVLIIAASAMALSLGMANFFPSLFADPMLKIYADEILPVAAGHVVAPIAALFTLLLLAGMIIKNMAGNSKSGAGTDNQEVSPTAASQS